MDFFPTTISDVLGPSSTCLPSASGAVQARVDSFADHVLVRVEGEVDMTAWPALASAREQLGNSRLPVVVDASGITFLDCEGLRALLSLGSDGRAVSLHAASRPVVVLLDAAARMDLLPVDGRTPRARRRPHDRVRPPAAPHLTAVRSPAEGRGGPVLA